MKKVLVFIALVTINISGLRADEATDQSHFFQASLTPDIAIYSKTTQINGIALDIWGQNPQYSFNLGFVNGSSGDSSGFTWGLVQLFRNLHRCLLGLGQRQPRPVSPAGRLALSMLRKTSSLAFSPELRKRNARSANGPCELHGRTSRRADRFGQHCDQQSVVQRVPGQARHRIPHRQLVVLMLPGRTIMNGITNAHDGISNAHFIGWNLCQSHPNGANMSKNAGINHRHGWKR